MNTVFRVDSSIQIGTGHLMRCLTLADALREKKATVSFICRELLGNLCDFVEKRGFKTYRLPFITAQYNNNNQSSEYAQWLGASWKEDAEQTRAILVKEGGVIDWLIVDHYALDKQWETLLRPYVKKIMVIDDLANRNHNCDLLLDQNLYENMETRYEWLVPEHCQKLFGTKYALLRPQFHKARENLRVRDGKVKRILIFMGGADPGNVTCKVLRAIQMLNQPSISIDVVIGASNTHANEVEALASNMPDTTCHFHVENMAELMANADLCIGAGGTSTWERCCLGLPSIVITIAENQKELAKHLEEKGIVMHLGWHKEVQESDIKEAVKKLLHNPKKIRIMSGKSRALVDGEGIKRVMNRIQKTLCVVNSIVLG